MLNEMIKLNKMWYFTLMDDWANLHSGRKKGERERGGIKRISHSCKVQMREEYSARLALKQSDRDEKLT